jgi:hypothetical protein
MVSVERLMLMGDRVLAADGEKLWAYNSTAADSGADFIDLGKIAEATVLRTPVTTLGSGIDSATVDVDFAGFDTAYGASSGMIAVACVRQDAVRVEVYDETTMQLLTDPDLTLPLVSGDPGIVRVGWLGSRLIVIYSIFNSAEIRGNYVDAANISTTATNGGFQATETVIVSNATASVSRVPLGAFFSTADAQVFMAYKDTSANDVRMAKVANDLSVVSTVATAVNPTITDIAVSYDAANVVMVALSVPAAPNTGLGLIAVDRAGWTVTGTNYSTGCVVVGSSYRCAVTNVSSGVWYAGLSVADTVFTSTEFTWRNFTDVCVAIGANALSAYNVAITGAMFSYNSKAYAVVGHVPPVLTTGPFVTTPSPIVIGPNGAFYVVELGTDFTVATNTLRWVATVAPGIVSKLTQRDDGTVNATYQVPQVTAINASKFVTFVPTNGSDKARVNLERLDIDFTDTKRWQSAELGGMVYVEGSRYDGRRTIPIGFGWAPTIASTTTTGVTTIAAGTYGYIALYERSLASGVMERSAPSNAVQVIVPVGGVASIGIVVTTCGTAAEDPGKIVLYRTTVGGSIYYRVPLSTHEGSANDVNASTVTITDTITDASLSDGSHPFIYTTDGTTPATTPPSFRFLTSEDNRLYGVGDDGRTVWFSQQFDGSSAPQFCLAYTFSVEDTGDIINAIGVLDGRKVFFTEDTTYVMSGQGPSRSNQSSDYSSPQRLPFGVGCTDCRSVVQTDDGLWFQSRRGIEMLSRSFDLVPFQELGAKIRRSLASYPTISSAVHVPEQSQVRFSLCSTDDVATARDGVVAVFDTRFKRWATHTYRQSQASASTCSPVSAIYHDTLGYLWAWDSASDALIKREKTSSDAARWLDYTSAWITKTVKTAWFKATDLQGWQKLRRIRLLAEWFTAHGISTSIFYDYQTTAEAHTYTEAVVTALLTNVREQIEITPGTMKSQALQFLITDTVPTTPGTGRGNALTGIAFEVVSLSGGARNIAQGGRT